MSDITSVGGSSSLQSFSYIESPVFQSLPPAIQDSLIRSFTIEELNERFSGPTVNVPTLLSPSSTSGSINDFFKTLNDAKVGLNQQFRTSDFIDQVTRKKESRSAGLAALGLVDQFSNRAAAVVASNEEAAQKTNELQEQATTMKDLVDAQNSLIDDSNLRYSYDQNKFIDFRSDYNAYIASLQLNGIVNNGNGTFTIPKGKENIFNSLTDSYQNSVNGINAYWIGRGSVISYYNSLTNSYNETVQSNNDWVTHFIEENDLQDYLDENHITVPVQETANSISTDGISSREPNPTKVSGTGPFTVTIQPPSTFAKNMANGVYDRSVSNISSITVFDTQEVGIVMEDKMYEKNVASMDSVISFNVDYWGFLRILSIFNPNVDYTPDPLLNFKPLSHKLIPNTIIDAAQPIATNNSQGAGTLAIQSIGLNTPHITAILGQAALAQSIRNLNLNLTQEQIAEAANQLLVLSLGLIGKNSLDALLPSLGPILSILSSLPPDSPALSLLFSLSFANRVQELAGQGLTSEALQALLQGIPHLKNLSPADLETLTTTINLGLLLVSTKLLESTLGLPGLSAQLLLPLLPQELVANILGRASTANQKSGADLQNQLQANFLDQGFQTDEASFLADLGVKLVNQNLLTPSLTTISQENVNRQLLTDSIKASLILSDSKAFNLVQADIIAREAVFRTFQDLDAKSSSVAQFKANLESNLQDLNVRTVATEEVLRDIILTAAQNDSLQPPALTNNSIAIQVTAEPVPSRNQIAAKQLVDNTATPQSATTPTTTLLFTPLTQAELIAILEQRAAELLVPQLGSQLAKQVTEEIAQTLFGTTNPDARDKAQLKSPLSLVNSVGNQIYHLKLDQNTQYVEAITEAFKETIITSKDFYAFSLKVMDPAYSFIYSVGTGVMYAGHEPSNWKKSIDIIV